LILIKVNEQPKLKELVLKETRMEENKIKDRPKFIYYTGFCEAFRIHWRE
jgi:hypothetical protein